MGNKLRFANHSKINQNSLAKIFFTEGIHKVGLFATRDISQYEEILFDYDGRNVLWKRFPWIKDNNPTKNNLKRNKYKKFKKEKKNDTSEISSEDNFEENDNERDQDFKYKTNHHYSDREMLLSKKRFRSFNKNKKMKCLFKRNKIGSKLGIYDDFSIDLTDLI